jgi:hypothetical protein
MIRTKTRLILGAVLGILGLVWAAMPLSAAGVGNLCDGKFIFKMNIIGVPKGKTPPMNNTSRKTIFVALNGSSDIYLTQGEFSVCDGNSFDPPLKCDGTPLKSPTNFTTGSVFQLPCNLNLPGGTDPTCAEGTTVACYDIFFRALGTPGGSVNITTCGILSDGTRVCSSETTDNSVPDMLVRNNGTPTFKKVTNQLTSIVVNGQRSALFSNLFQYFLWQYDNSGLRVGMVIFCGANCD